MAGVDFPEAGSSSVRCCPQGIRVSGLGEAGGCITILAQPIF